MVFREILSDKRLVRYLVLNIVLSALTALVVLALWSHFVFKAGAPPPFPDTPLAVATSATAQIQVVAVVGAGDLQSERITIQHVGDQNVTLAGWRLQDANGIEFRFPALVLHPGAQVAIYSRQGDDTVTELYWDRQVPVWSPGELVSLLDAAGALQARYTVP